MNKKLFLLIILLAVTTFSMAEDNIADKLAGKWKAELTTPGFKSEVHYNIIKTDNEPEGIFTMNMDLDVTMPMDTVIAKIKLSIDGEGTWESESNKLIKKIDKLSCKLKDLYTISSDKGKMTIKDFAEEEGTTEEEFKKEFEQSINLNFALLLVDGDDASTKVHSTITFVKNDSFWETTQDTPLYKCIPGNPEGNIPYRYYRVK